MPKFANNVFALNGLKSHLGVSDDHNLQSLQIITCVDHIANLNNGGYNVLSSNILYIYCNDANCSASTLTLIR